MANTYSSLYFHVVFSTKLRQRWISQEFEQDVWDEIGSIVKCIGCQPIKIGGIEDHIHSLMRVPPKIAPSEAVQKMKSNSPRAIHQKFGKLRIFAWQDGYSIFSVSKSIAPQVVKYIENQRIHHESISYEDEYLELLRLHEIDLVDEKYVFG